MNYQSRISRIFERASQITFDDSSRIVLISDCHRGNGSWADDFAKNQNLYHAALTHYFIQGFTYIEIGDGDELWKNRRMEDILDAHSDIYWLLSQFYKEGRLYCIYGNHDLEKKGIRFVQKNLTARFDEHKKAMAPLLDGLSFYESILLCHAHTGGKLFLLHGHQADFLNSDLWLISRFLVRYLWKPLELIGVHDPTSASKNFRKKERVEKNLINWAARNNQALIAGHIHRAYFSEPGETPYFNDGSCVLPYLISAIEIFNGTIQLVKWRIKTRNDGTLFVGRDTSEGPIQLISYFKAESPAESSPEKSGCL